jgi:hypothetical protein
VPPGDSLTDPATAPPSPATDSIPPMSESAACANGDEEIALARLADDGGPVPPTGATPVPPTVMSLEQRVQLLEEAVALLQGRRASARASPAPTAIRLDFDKPPQGPASPVATAVPASMPGIVRSSPRGSLLWLLWDTWAEVRAIVRMFVDPRYQLPWSARVLPLVILVAILASNLWVPFSSVPFLGGLLVKLVDLPLAFLLFKWLGHEARRYRQTSPDLPANLRL